MCVISTTGKKPSSARPRSLSPALATTAKRTQIVAAIDALAARVDYLYLHIDADILDEAFQPNHPTAEPNGPDDTMVDALIEHVMSTGKVVALAVVSINPQEPGGAISLASGQQMMRTGLRSWAAAGATV